jgi:membrane fusion protein (multidrug efflux system)
VSVRGQAAIVALLLILVAGIAWYLGTPGAPGATADRGGPQAVPVELAAATSGQVAEQVEAVGSTLARQAVDIVPLTSGRVASLDFTPGQQVAHGDVLVRLDDAAEQAAVDEARALLREAELGLERAKRLRSNNNVAQATVDELEAAYAGARARLDRVQKELDERTIEAPFAGIVGMRRVDVGARVDDDSVLTTVDDLTEVEIEFAVPEVFYGRIRPDQPVQATSSAFPGRVFQGRIAAIDSRIDETGRAFLVRAMLPNPDLLLPAGMFMHVMVILNAHDAVLVPEEAVVAEGTSTYVFTADGDRARRVELELGRRLFGEVEVVEGLEAGTQVVVKGVHRLRDGMPIEIRAAGPRAASGGATS